MAFNSKIHHRRSIRLKGYDYSQPGLYFITICCQDRINRFGNVENGEMVLNEFGHIAHNEWQKLTERFINMDLGAFQIMPNHIHGIILLKDTPVGTGFTPVQNEMKPQNEIELQNEMISQNNDGICAIKRHGENERNEKTTIEATARVAPTAVPDIVGAYKSLVANGCLAIFKSYNQTMGKLWQRNYYEIIIRNEKSYQHISEYIINNPSKWQNDKFYLNKNTR